MSHRTFAAFLAVPLLASSAGALELEPCELEGLAAADRLEAECGELAVPLDHRRPDAGQLKLFVARLAAAERKPAPDPIFFLAGGPGQAASETYPQLAGALARLNVRRDVVLVDQRGTGRSSPLDCPSDALTELLSLPQAAEALRGCLSTLPADPRYFGTDAAVADLDAVRAALGYPTINLIGVSYGTRVAQAYAGRFPQHTRTMVLDGVVAPTHAVGQSIATDGQQALDLLFARCARDRACAAAFPAPGEALRRLFDRFAGSSISVALEHPTSGAALTLPIDRDVLAGIVRLLLYSPETASLLPLLIRHGVESPSGPDRLVAQALIGGERVARSISQGMLLSVVCAEDVPFLDLERARRDAAATVFGTAFLDFLEAACSFWPVDATPTEDRQLLRSDVPTLLLSGEADPVTPPARAEEVAGGLSRSLHLVGPEMGHNLLFRGCVPRVVGDFLDRGSVESVDGRCVAELRPPPIFVSPTGPLPSGEEHQR